MSDSEGSEGSEGSDHVGYLAEPDHNHDLDEGDESDASASAASDPDTDGSRINLFDLEAADSDDDRSGSEESGIGRHRLGLSDDGDHFPQFRRLPYELRCRVWAFFCPELTAKSCVYWFHLQQCRIKSDGARGLVAFEGPFLEQQTRPARAMLAVHHESRQLALKAFPDTLSFGSEGILRLNSARDVVFLGSAEAVMLDLEAMPPLPGLSEHVRHLAVEPALLRDLDSRSSALFEAFENLKTVYYTTSPTEHRRRHLRWCTSDLVRRYSVTTFEEQSGLGEDGHHVYCWPDLENHREFAEAHIPLGALAEDLRGDGIDIKGASFRGVAIWPMVQFSRDDLDHFDNLLAGHGEGDQDWESSDGEDDGEPDEYESEGIDDSYISDGSLDSDPRDDLVVLDDDSSDQGGEDSEDSSSPASSSLPLRAQVGVIDLTGDDREGIAAFSSPEQSSTTLQGTDEPAEDSEQPASRFSRLKRPRRLVVEPEDEEDSDDDVPRKRARTTSRQNITVSSSDEEDGLGKMPVGRRARRVISEDEDEDEDEDDEEQVDAINPNASSAREEGPDWSGLSSSDEQDEESEGGATVAKPLSLAEKLQLHRQQNLVPLSDSGESEMEEMGGDDYDAGDYAGFQDDEEGNGGSDDGRDDDVLEDEDEEDYGY